VGFTLPVVAGDMLAQLEAETAAATSGEP